MTGGSTRRGFTVLLRLILVSALITGFHSAVSSEQDEEKDAVVRINEALDEDDFELAIELLEEAIEEDPESTEYLWKLIDVTGDSLCGAYDPIKALDACENLYYLLDEDDDEAELDELETLTDDIWSEHLVDLSLDIPSDPDKAFKAVSGRQMPVFIYFYTTWCPACKQMSAVIDKMKLEDNDKVLLIQIDRDSDQGRELRRKFKPEHIPTSVFVDRKGDTARYVGGITKKGLERIYSVITDFHYEENLKDGENLHKHLVRKYGFWDD